MELNLVIVVATILCFVNICLARLEMTNGGYAIMNDNSQQTEQSQNQGEIIIHGIDNPPSTEAVQNVQTAQIQTPNANVNLGRLQVLQNNFARRIGISTLMMGGLFYGLTLLPALAAAVGGGGGLGSFLPSLLGKRSLPDDTRTQTILPLLTGPETAHLMAVLEGTFHAKKITGATCKQFHVCDVYRQVATSSTNPSLQAIEENLLKTFGILVERKYSFQESAQDGVSYFDSARNGLDKLDCAALYPCALTAPNQSSSSPSPRGNTGQFHRPS